MSSSHKAIMPTDEQVKDLSSVNKHYLYYKEDAERQADLQHHIDEKGQVSRVFEHALPPRTFVSEIVKMCEEVAKHEEDAQLPERQEQLSYLGGDSLLNEHMGSSLFNDNGELHTWVMNGLDNKQWANDLALLLKNIFTMSSRLTIDDNGELRGWIKEFIKEDRFVKITEKFGKDKLRWYFITGIATFQGMAISTEVQKEKLFVQIASVITKFLNHQIKADEIFVEEYAEFSQNMLENNDFKQSDELKDFFKNVTQEYHLLIKDPCRDYAKLIPLLKLANSLKELDSKSEKYQKAFANLIKEVKRFNAIKPLMDSVNALNSSHPCYQEANTYLTIHTKAINEAVDSANTEKLQHLTKFISPTIDFLDGIKDLDNAIVEGEESRGPKDVYVATSKLIKEGICDKAKALLKNPALDPTHEEKKLLIEILSTAALGARKPSDPAFAERVAKLIKNPKVPGHLKENSKWIGGLLIMAGLLTITAGVAVSICTFGAGTPLAAVISSYGVKLISSGLLVAGGLTLVTGANTLRTTGIAKNLGKLHKEITAKKKKLENPSPEDQPIKTKHP